MRKCSPGCRPRAYNVHLAAAPKSAFYWPTGVVTRANCRRRDLLARRVTKRSHRATCQKVSANLRIPHAFSRARGIERLTRLAQIFANCAQKVWKIASMVQIWNHDFWYQTGSGGGSVKVERCCAWEKTTSPLWNKLDGKGPTKITK